MSAKRLAVGKRVGRVLKQCLDEGKSVEIDGLGIFRRKSNGYEFLAEPPTRVFIAYVEEDLPHARRLYDALQGAGFNPWLDKKKLLPGQNWPRAIQRAISVSDFFLACFSSRAAVRRSRFNSELRFALQCAAEHPLDDVFVIPVRLDECDVPKDLKDRIQYVDVFPEWDAGFRRIVLSMERQLRARRKR